MADFIVPAIATLAVPFVDHGLREIKSIFEAPTATLNDMHKALKFGFKRLVALQDDKDREVALNVVQKDPSHVYLLWKKEVSSIEKDVNSLEKQYEEVGNNYEGQALPDKMKMALDEIIKHFATCPKEILVNKLPERVIKETGVPSIEEYQRLQNAFKEILALVQQRDNGVTCVALHGQKGVGKTTIMQSLNNHFCASDDKLFDIVIFIKVPSNEQTKDLHILHKIADRLKVDREGNEPADVVAGSIRKVLENKRYLLILDGVRLRPTFDDIWEELAISKDKRNSKVVITTNYPLPVKSPFVDRIVKTETLLPEDAWKMFENIVGDSLRESDKPTARAVCERFCCRLPLLINRIAKSFTDQEFLPDWQRTLEECTPWPEFGVEGLREIYSILKFCYDQLGDQGGRKCFLYASLYPANSKIYTEYFVECCIAQGFLGVVNAATKYSTMRSRINSILTHLVRVAFLEEDDQSRYVKMNDLDRQLALYISSKSKCRTYVYNEEREEDFRSTSWQKVRWVSMVDSKRDSLPRNQNWRRVQTLFLQKNSELVQIPSDYFGGMGNLLVLNLHRTKISNMPPLSGLTNLKVFYINGCSELTISLNQIKPLKHLEVLDIRDTKVDFMPCMESLRCLRTSYIASSTYHGISELHKLEELTIEVQSLEQWCCHAENIIQLVNSSKSLTTFKCKFLSPAIDLRNFLEANEAPVDWVGSLIGCKALHQVGVCGLSSAEARKMFEDIAAAKPVCKRPHLEKGRE